ncbi:SGNH/GDSL hydrolase family protein [Amycolatopsis albispora]|uniref:G-D-S-L family lipolytic protein n=1 Tax=Amycolatopsis albispora TaxID=1804986 RepID=A0A344L958_9PSEU|nr:SGNH/GDSL hydrolase family protein [Amycolatopsis albispora]AXB44582.1 G-D-S-L family lipolytic protein [Amycolatopsis albispora]
MKRRLLGLLLGLVTTAAIGTAPTAAATPESGLWAGTWATAVQKPSSGLGPNWSEAGFADHSVRQVVRVASGGVSARIRLSNEYGGQPLRLTGATVARAGEGAAVKPGSVRDLRFRGARSAEIPAGGELRSDPLPLLVAPLEELTVTLYFREPTGPVTAHVNAIATSYRASGDHRADTGAAAFTETSTSWYLLSGVEVLAPGKSAVVAFGDSITEGALSTVDADNRYPDELAERLGGKRPVLNTGIGGNRVLTDSNCLGEKATARFERDVVAQPGVRSVIVLEGINDIGMSAFPPDDCLGPTPWVSAAELIAGHRELIKQAKAAGIRVIGGTLTPFKGSFYFSEEREAVRDEVNHWIRTSGEYDAVVDFDRALADPADEDLMLAAYDSGDRLHPNDAGYHAMAAAIDVKQL